MHPKLEIFELIFCFVIMRDINENRREISTKKQSVLAENCVLKDLCE